MLSGEHVLALTAPAIEASFSGNIESLILQAGFSAVESVLPGAVRVIEEEADALACTVSENSWLFTSCCGAYRELERKMLDFLGEKRGFIQTPLKAAADIYRRKYPDYRIIFIGPCIAKKAEVYANPDLDGMLTFDELTYLFYAKGIEFERGTLGSSPYEKNNLLSSGIARTVAKQAGLEHIDIYTVSGLDRSAIAELASWKTGTPPAIFAEALACPGGCMNGPGNLEHI